MKDKSKLILVLGGARSGKSRFAQTLAGSMSRDVVYLATAQGLDDEMLRRIDHHKKKRPGYWKTIEEPLEIVRVLKKNDRKGRVFILDCLTLLISNYLAADKNEEEILREIRRIARTAKTMKAQLIVVSNEVGSGIVPHNPSAREFRDIAGMSNQILAESAGQVILMVSGLPMFVKTGEGKYFRVGKTP